MKKNFLIALFLSTLLLAACSEVSSESATPDTIPAEFAGKTNPLGAEAAANGANVYQVNCEACHGTQGHGDGPAGIALNPQPKNLPELAAQVGDDYLFWRISTGIPGTSMAPWGNALTDEQIWQTIVYVRTLK